MTDDRCTCPGCDAVGVAPSGMCGYCDETMELHQHCTQCGAAIVRDVSEVLGERDANRRWRPAPRRCAACEGGDP